MASENPIVPVAQDTASIERTPPSEARQFRAMLRDHLRAIKSGDAGKRTMGQILLFNSIEQLEKAIEKGERWAIELALTLTVGKPEDFAADMDREDGADQGISFRAVETTRTRMFSGRLPSHNGRHPSDT